MQENRVSRETFFVAGGTLGADAGSYVARRADSELLESLRRGEFAYVLDSRQKGKSSLMIRTRQVLESEGTLTVLIDLQRFGSNLDPERWYASMLLAAGQELRLEDRLLDLWDEQKHAGPMQRFFGALERGTAELGKPVVVFVDEIDYVRSLPFSTDEFFAGIREYYNRRASGGQSHLGFCLLGVATPSELIRDVQITPFNVGTRVELTDFTLDELAPYAAALSQDGRDGAALVRRIHRWTGGHPYLTQRMASAVAAQPAVRSAGGLDRVAESLFFSVKARAEEPNLTDVSRRVLESPIEGVSPEEARSRILDLYRQVREGRRVRDDETDSVVSILKLSGLTRVLEGYLLVRNQVYFRAFDRAWLEANLPEAETVRQRRAAHRAILRTSLVAGAVVLAVGAAAAFGFVKAADEAKARKVALDANERTMLALKEAEDERVRADGKAIEAENQRARANDKAIEAERASRLTAQQAKKLAAAVEEKANALTAAQRDRSRAQASQGLAVKAQARLSEVVASQRQIIDQSPSLRANAAAALVRKALDSKDKALLAVAAEACEQALQLALIEGDLSNAIVISHQAYDAYFKLGNLAQALELAQARLQWARKLKEFNWVFDAARDVYKVEATRGKPADLSWRIEALRGSSASWESYESFSKNLSLTGSTVEVSRPSSDTSTWKSYKNFSEEFYAETIQLCNEKGKPRLGKFYRMQRALRHNPDRILNASAYQPDPNDPNLQTIIPSIEFEEADFREGLRIIFRKIGVSYSIDPDVQGFVTLNYKNAKLGDILTEMLDQVGAVCEMNSGVYHISQGFSLAKGIQIDREPLSTVLEIVRYVGGYGGGDDRHSDPVVSIDFRGGTVDEFLRLIERTCNVKCIVIETPQGKALFVDDRLKPGVELIDVAPSYPMKRVKPVVKQTGDQENLVSRIARRYLLTPYRRYGNMEFGLGNSGLIQFVFGQVGIDLPRMASQQIRQGRSIANGEVLRPGDCLYFLTPQSPYLHSGIYAGNGAMYESLPPDGVKLTRLSDFWLRHLVAARRF